MENKVNPFPRLYFVLASLVCITIFGLVGNVLTLITVLQIRCKKTSFIVFIAALAITDSIVLILMPLHISMRYVDVGNSAALLCKFLAFFLYGSRHISVWLVAVLTVERAFAVYFPSKVKTYCTTKTGLIVVAIVITIVAATELHFLFGYTFTNIGNTKDCGFADEGFAAFYLFTYPWVDLTVGLILPAIVIIASNSAILVRVFKSTSAVSTTTTGLNRKDKNKQLLRIAFLVSTAFLVLSSPCLVYLLLRPYLYELSNSSYKLVNGTDATLLNIVINLIILNHGINFLLYVFSGKRFRNEFRNAFRCRSLATVQPESQPGTSSTSRNVYPPENAIKRDRATERTITEGTKESNNKEQMNARISSKTNELLKARADVEMSLVARIPVLTVSDQYQNKSDCITIIDC